jgi:NAD kinase
MTMLPRVVIVHRRTEYENLVAHHGTRRQVGFYLSTRGRNVDEVESRHIVQQDAFHLVTAAIPLDWRRGHVERGDLDRFVFGPEDVVVAVGQDGLVANVAKYLSGQVVIGVNPEPARNPGVLVRHSPQAMATLLPNAVAPDVSTHLAALVMVQATLDDGQTLRALNEIFVGHPSHQSARYRLTMTDGQTERHSSSGVIVGTGTGSTGWCRSVWRERASTLRLPAPQQPELCWFARETWPSPATGTAMTEGLITGTEQLTLTAESDLVLFGDGIESDRINLSWGQSVRVAIADLRLHLLT